MNLEYNFTVKTTEVTSAFKQAEEASDADIHIDKKFDWLRFEISVKLFDVFKIRTINATVVHDDPHCLKRVLIFQNLSSLTRLNAQQKQKLLILKKAWS